MICKTAKNRKETGSAPALTYKKPISVQKPTPVCVVPPCANEKNKDVDNQEDVWYKSLYTNEFLELIGGSK